jgi:hypothetical protein
VILAVQAQATLIDFTQLGLRQGNLGQSLVIDDLSISALTQITTTGSYEGTIYLDSHHGLGVQTLSGCGSTGISGRGADQDEALIFDFTEGVFASSLQVGLSQYKANKDEPIITATLSSGGQLSFSESSTNWSNAVTNLGYGRITVDVGLLLGGERIGQNDAVSRLYVKETSDHVYVRSLGYESVPEPATVGLLGFGSLALLCTPGKRKKM